MHLLVFEMDFHRQLKYTDEGCAFLETHGEVEIIRQADQQDREALFRFLERVPVADGIVIGPWHRPATTHIAGGTDFCHRRCFTDACKDAVAVIKGNEPRFRATLWDDACYQGKLD